MSAIAVSACHDHVTRRACSAYRACRGTWLVRVFLVAALVSLTTYALVAYRTLGLVASRFSARRVFRQAVVAVTHADGLRAVWRAEQRGSAALQWRLRTLGAEVSSGTVVALPLIFLRLKASSFT